MKGSFYLFTLPRDYERGNQNIECITRYMHVEDVIYSALHSAIEYVNQFHPRQYDAAHWHYNKQDVQMQRCIDESAILAYEEIATPDNMVGTTEFVDQICQCVYLPFNAIRNHLIYAVIQLAHTTLVREGYAHVININWLSHNEFVVVLDAGNKDLQHHTSFLNKEPVYV